MSDIEHSIGLTYFAELQKNGWFSIELKLRRIYLKKVLEAFRWYTGSCTTYTRKGFLASINLFHQLTYSTHGACLASSINGTVLQLDYMKDSKSFTIIISWRMSRSILVSWALFISNFVSFSYTLRTSWKENKLLRTFKFSACLFLDLQASEQIAYKGASLCQEWSLSLCTARLCSFVWACFTYCILGFSISMSWPSSA